MVRSPYYFYRGELKLSYHGWVIIYIIKKAINTKKHRIILMWPEYPLHNLLVDSSCTNIVSVGYDLAICLLHEGHVWIVFLETHSFQQDK